MVSSSSGVLCTNITIRFYLVISIETKHCRADTVLVTFTCAINRSNAEQEERIIVFRAKFNTGHTRRVIAVKFGEY